MDIAQKSACSSSHAADSDGFARRAVAAFHRLVAARRVPAHLMPLMESAEMEDAQAAAEQVISSRGGSMLGKKTILKSDHFPGCQNRRLSPQIDGAPNYRQVHLLPPCMARLARSRPDQSHHLLSTWLRMTLNY
jgi:hypothetical protein